MINIRLQDLQFPLNRMALEELPQGRLLINTVNAHSYNTARQDPEFAEALLKGDILIPDGASIVLAVRWLRDEKIERIAGWDLFVWEMEQLERKAKSIGQRAGKVFFLGSSEAVLEKIKIRAAKNYPSLDIYTYSPPYKPEFEEEDNREMIDAINKVQPDLLWIGMTTPKQEKWAYQHYPELNVKGHIGTIGAVFDFYAGTLKRAPIWWQEHCLEWLYRFLKEPKRMWKRYLIGNFKFIFAVWKEKYGI